MRLNRCASNSLSDSQLHWIMLKISDAAGIYIHIPFCFRKCPYCDFYSITGFSRIPAYLNALHMEMALTEKAPLRFDSLYIGGGTPSVLSPDQVSTLCEKAFLHFNFSDDVEITLETNPGTVDLNRFKAYRAAGVNRVTIGVQSFSNDRLKFLGRIHTSNEAREAVEAAGTSGFDNICLDLIYGIPGQTEDSWIRDLETALSYSPDHISCYMLTCEPGTPLDNDRLRGRFKPMGDQTQGVFFRATGRFLAERGFDRYEISNFARCPSKQSRHNSKYWISAPYIGLGASAHSFIDPVRYWNHRSVEDYISDLANEKPPRAGSELLTRQQRIIEEVFLRLRTGQGIDMDAFDRKFGISFAGIFQDPVMCLADRGLLEVSGRQCRLSEEGMLFHDGIAAMFARMKF